MVYNKTAEGLSTNHSLSRCGWKDNMMQAVVVVVVVVVAAFGSSTDIYMSTICLPAGVKL